jgi:hypothetical protein
MAAAITVVLFLVGTAVSIVSIVAVVTIISKAGYSGWWILSQFVPPIIGWLVSILVIKIALSTGTPSADKLFGADLIVVVIMFASYLVSWGFFIAFAFGDWPSLQMKRYGPRGRPDSGTFGPSGPGPVNGTPPAFLPQPSAPQSPPTEGQPPGWYRSGAIGAGEQSYWDGAVWRARRRWQNNAWVDLPPPVVETVAAEGNVSPDAPAETS